MDVRSMVDVKDDNDARGFVDAIDDPVSAPSRAEATGEWSEEGSPNALRVDSERCITKLQNRGRDRFRQSVRYRPAARWLESDLVALRLPSTHPPVPRRRVRSARTVAMSEPD